MPRPARCSRPEPSPRNGQYRCLPQPELRSCAVPPLPLTRLMILDGRGCLAYEPPGAGAMSVIQGVARLTPGEPTADTLRPHSQEPLHVLHGGRRYVDPAVEVLDPVDRHLGDAI